MAEIISRGLLNIRFYAAEGDAGAALIEAEHIHNLPALLYGGGEQELPYYLAVERPAYLTQSSTRSPCTFHDAWRHLESLTPLQAVA